MQVNTLREPVHTQQNYKRTALSLKFILFKLRQTEAKPFRVLGLQQIAVGGLDKGPLQALWVGTVKHL